jgi:hypothetical protein
MCLINYEKRTVVPDWQLADDIEKWLDAKTDEELDALIAEVKAQGRSPLDDIAEEDFLPFTCDECDARHFCEYKEQLPEEKPKNCN